MNKIAFLNSKNIMYKFIIYFFLIINSLSVYSNIIIKKNLPNDFNYKETPLYISNNDSINKDSTNFKIPKNSVYFELLGCGFLGSINYERVFIEKKNNVINGRIGFFSLVLSGPVVIIPTLLNYQTKINRYISFEIGVGLQFVYGGSLKDHEINFIGNFGFRLLIKKNFLFKINFTPFSQKGYNYKKDTNTLSFQPWGGLSIGYSFGK